MREPKRTQISSGRKALFYGGMLVALAGLALFLSVFLAFAANFGNFDDFGGQMTSQMVRAIGGMGLIMVGSAMMRIGRRGAAGSGLLLDPEQAREDLEPWARMGGGIVNDALEEVDVLQKPVAEETVKVRCRSCRQLNDEEAKYCDQCGAEM